MTYAELHCLSNFSFLRGASHPEELVERSHALGYAALALTDECSLAGVVRAHVAARALEFKLIVGTEVTLEDGLRLVLLAPDGEAYGDLSALITRGRRNAAKGEYRLTRADVERCCAARCVALWIAQSRDIPLRRRGEPPDSARNCIRAMHLSRHPSLRAPAGGAAIQGAATPAPGLLPPGQARRRNDVGGAVHGEFPVSATKLHTDHEPPGVDAHAAWLREHFEQRAFIALALSFAGGERAHIEQLERCSREFDLPLIAAGGVRMHARSRQPLADVLTAVRRKTTVAGAGMALAANAERHLRTIRRLERLYPRALLDRTLAIAEQCRFSLAELRYRYPREVVPAAHTPAGYLRELTEAGIRRRWPDGESESVRSQIERELELIGDLEYEAYFLTVYDIVHFARARNILCQGRGSAANSAVCYCLGITEVDPSRVNLLFERFISRERNEPPDIDIDFEHERREEVIQYIYAKYGRDRAALAATVITYQPRSALRDVGKALGMDLDQVDRLAKNMSWWDGRDALPARLREAGFDPDSRVIRQLLDLVGELIGFPRHLSQHVGGFVIADAALDRLVPIENAAMPERTVIQWDKDDLEALGLLKVDCLCLGMLTAIHRAFDLIEGGTGRKMGMADVPPEDPATYAMIQRADTVGVFQIESRAQMAMLPRLKPANYYDLVIEVAIIRPGPIQGEMVHPYLRRRNGEEPVTYPSEAVRAVLERTLGVPLFQEQVIKLAMVAAGFSGGEADQLRRSMAAWKRTGGLEPFRDRLIEGMRARGYDDAFAERIFKQIQGFGEYGFPESHSASFALLAYVSAWLKCHAPAAFTAALLNSQPMGFYAPAQLVQDAQRHGVEVRPADVCVSDWDCTLERSSLRLGLRMVKGLTGAGAARIVEARRRAPFSSIADLCRRAGLQQHDVKALAAGDALAGIAGNRHLAVWGALGVEAPLPLLEDDGPREGTPMLRPPSLGEGVVADYAHLGLTLRPHPLALLRGQLQALQFLTAVQVRALSHGSRIRTGGLVITRQRPGTATGVVFVTLEDETGFINLIVWSSLVEAQRRELLEARFLGVSGEVQREGEVVHVIAHHLEDHTPLLGALQTLSRDFR